MTSEEKTLTEDEWNALKLEYHQMAYRINKADAIRTAEKRMMTKDELKMLDDFNSWQYAGGYRVQHYDTYNDYLNGNLRNIKK